MECPGGEHISGNVQIVADAGETLVIITRERSCAARCFTTTGARFMNKEDDAIY